jgi:hypothetical protein
VLCAGILLKINTSTGTTASCRRSPLSAAVARAIMIAVEGMIARIAAARRFRFRLRLAVLSA